MKNRKKLNFSSERKRDNVNISQLQLLQHGRDIVFKLSGLEVVGGGGARVNGVRPPP